MRFVFDDKEARIFSEQFKKKDSLLAQHTQRLLSRLVEGWVNKVRGNFSGWYRGPNRTGSTPSGKLRNRGKLKASVGGRVLGEKRLSTMRAVFRVGGKSAPYAEIQEEGKKISRARVDSRARRGSSRTVTAGELLAWGARSSVTRSSSQLQPRAAGNAGSLSRFTSFGAASRSPASRRRSCSR